MALLTQNKNIETLAIAKAIKETAEKAARNQIEAGEYMVDVLCRISGLIKVGQDYEQRIVAKADPWLLLGVALSHLNQVTVESIVAEAVGKQLDTEEIKTSASRAMAKIKGETVTNCKGKVTTDLMILTGDEI